MNWVRSNYDRVAVLAGAVFLLLCAFFIWRNAAAYEENFAALQGGGAKKTAVPSGQAVELESAAEKLLRPPQWVFSGRSGLFVPEKHFIGPTGVPTTLQTTEVHAPVPNEWLEQFGLPIAESDVLSQDPDGDGFTNLEEWHGRTNPVDPKSHPPFTTKLKMKSFTREPFRLVFASWTGDTFGINSVDLREATQFVPMGELIRGTKFRIAAFTEKYEPNQYGTEVDVSELTIAHEETKERLTLVKEKVMISPQSVVTFVYTWGEQRELVIKKDQEFLLPPETQIRYKLIDVQPDKAVIVNTQKPDERIEIGLLAP
ncbi:MAG: hypothetical protein H0V56_08060 [Chthoniobacterales bacterium]|nr:hypothetical protein [Chthoniobacterales bacterium]